MDLHENHSVAIVDDDGDDARVAYYRACELRSYFLVLVGMPRFVEKIMTYVNVIYLKYFIDLNIRVEKWVWHAVPACLTHHFW